jgi:predicted PurR-regulated permease PerM
MDGSSVSGRLPVCTVKPIYHGSNRQIKMDPQIPQPRIRVLEIFFLLLLVALTYGFYRVIKPFVLNIFLAFIFTSVLFPAFERLRRRLGERTGLASITMVLLVFVVIAIPVTFISILVYSEAVSGYAAFLERLPGLSVRLREIVLLDWIAEVPLIGQYTENLETVNLSQMLRNAVSTISNFILTATQRSFVSVSAAVANFLLVLLLMFFMFHGGHDVATRIYDVLPIPNRELREIAADARRTTTATLISTFLIGLIEGSFGTMLFLIFGLPSPVIWGLVIMVLSMIPLIGTNLVLVPAGAILIVTGRMFAGIAVIMLGLAGVAVTQNVIKPKLLGDRSGLNPALALLATIGGIAWLGLIGFLVGPLVASLFIVVWQQFAKRYRAELSEKDIEPDTLDEP